MSPFRHFFDVVVADPQHFGHEVTHHPDRQAAGHRLKPDGPLGQAHEPRAESQQQLHEANRSQSADHAEHRVDTEFRRMDQLIAGDVEQRIVAQNQVQDHPGGGRAQHHGAQHRGVQIAHDLFEREQDRRDGRIECRRQRRRATRRHQRLHLFRTESEIPRDHRGESGAHLHRRSFAPERDAAGQRSRAAEELSEHGSKQDSSVVDEECELGLRDAAAAREREIAPQKIAGAERTEHRNQNPPPARSLRRIHAGREPAGQQDKRHHHQADQSADHQAEDQRQLVFVLPKSLKARC